MICPSEKYVMAIDPGDKESAFCLVSEANCQPIFFRKEPNAEMWKDVFMACETVGWEHVDFAIEMIASYGMPVGAEVFNTVLWIGQMKDRIEGAGKVCHFVFRKDEKMTICHSMKATDATIRQALIDRFAPGVPNKGKGTKKEPGWFYGFRADIWQAYAVAITYIDMKGG